MTAGIVIVIAKDTKLWGLKLRPGLHRVIPSVIMIEKQISHFDIRISQTLVFLDFVKPVLDKDTYFIMNKIPPYRFHQ